MSFNASIVVFNDNSSGYLIEFNRGREAGNLPVTILGRNRNDYQSVGIGIADYSARIYTSNESQYNNLMKDLYSHKEIKMTIDSYNYYVVPTNIHKNPISEGMINDLYICDVNLISVDPLRYKNETTRIFGSTSITDTVGNCVVSGDIKTASDIEVTAYDLNITTVTWTATNTTIQFGRKDSLGFNHLTKAWSEVPRFGYDDNNNFWGNIEFTDSYVLPPLNYSSGNCTYIYCEFLSDDGSIINHNYVTPRWSWGLSSFSTFNIQDIQRLYVNDGDHMNWPSLHYTGNVYAPMFYRTGTIANPCELYVDCPSGVKRENSIVCEQYWSEDGNITGRWATDDQGIKHWSIDKISGYHAFYGKQTGGLGHRYSSAIGALKLDFQNDTHFNKIELLLHSDIPVNTFGAVQTDGLNVWMHNNDSWNAVVFDNRRPIDFKHGYQDISFNITQGNYSSDWYTDGSLIYLFMTQIAGFALCSKNPPWKQYIENNVFSGGKLQYGVDFLRCRIYREDHRIASIVKRNLKLSKYLAIDGINNIANNTVIIDLVNASSGGIGEFVYATEKVSSANWSNEHIIPLSAVNYLPNASYLGVTLRLEDELLGASTLPMARLYNTTSGSIIQIYGGSEDIDFGDYGIITETPVYYNRTHIDKSFVKELSEVEYLTKVRIYNTIDPNRIFNLYGPIILGKYSNNGKEEDSFEFDAFQNVSNSYYGRDGSITFKNGSIGLGTSSIKYIISPNTPIIRVPSLLIKGNISTLYVSSDNEIYNNIKYIPNNTIYLGTSNVDVRGLERFFIKLNGGNYSYLKVQCNVGTGYDMLPFVYPNINNQYTISKSADINATVGFTYQEAYY